MNDDKGKLGSEVAAANPSPNEAPGKNGAQRTRRKRIVAALVIAAILVAILAAWAITVRVTSDTEPQLSVSESVKVSGPKNGPTILFTSVVGDSPEVAARKLDLAAREFPLPTLVPNSRETKLSDELIVTAVCINEAGEKQVVFQVANPSEISPAELAELKAMTPAARTNDIATKAGCRSQVIGLVALK